ncbi:hypothetical protein [Spirulina sp. 06S082]|uniref:hypothetical protein n=1 Tax=Spirulina sp. 06S082 TaxID=3110248 RepID=UPI002B220C52|nr:hypothetical protein [Spirulina sp. 06S082]MEA5470907.1 hypothetical protein [Spirulina sp. 06S082]
MLPQAQSLPAISSAILLTTFFAIAFGFVFKDMLEYQVDFWAKNRQTQDIINYKKPQMLVAYLGLTFFLTFFVGECLSVFKIGYLFAGGIALFVVLPTALLMWVQLGSMLELLSRGGSEAISIDTYLEEKAMKIAAKK